MKPGRILDRSMVVLYCLVAALPCVAMRMKLHDHPIFGVLPPAPYPKVSFDAMRAEQFQAGYTAWFENRLGFKGYSIATDNTLLYHVFHETKVGSQVAVGLDGHLLKDEDLAYYNKNGAYLPDQAEVDHFADRIADVQARLRAQHRAFVPLFIPSKTSLFADKVPDHWTRDLGHPRPSDQRIYGALKRALDARKVVYSDARALFETRRSDRDLLWGRDARHWSPYGACLAMIEVSHAYAELSGRPALDYQCPLVQKIQPKTVDDFDMWRLLNAWGIRRLPQRVPIVGPRQGPPGAAPPRVLFIGTSFQWTLLRDAYDSHLFGALHFNSYNKVFIEWPSGVGSDVRPFSKSWNDIVLDKDLYVLDLFEVYLFAPNHYADQFLDELGSVLDPVPDGSAPTTGAAITDVHDLGITDGAHHFELWGNFPAAQQYQATVICDGRRRKARVYYQDAKAWQLNVSIPDPGVGTCDTGQTPARASGVSCTFSVQGVTVGSPVFGPRRVCPGPQGESGQDPDGQCKIGLIGC